MLIIGYNSLSMPNKKEVVAVSSVHLKGGCGKTTLLTDLGIVLAQNGIKVLAVDTDMQGSMYSTLTGISPKRYYPQDRHQYLYDLLDGNSIHQASTKYPDVNTNLTVCHYPIQMFSHDQFYKTGFESGFINAVQNPLTNARVVLIDMPPAKLEGSDTAPFLAMQNHINRYHFLISSRPTFKEIEDGLFCYEAFRQLMVTKGVDPKSLRMQLVLNLHAIEHIDFVWGTDRVETITIASSRFPNIEASRRELHGIKVPEVSRAGTNMDHYSILLDNNFNWQKVVSLPPASELLKLTSTDRMLSYSDLLIDEIEHPNPALESQREYLKALDELASVVKAAY